MVSLSFSLCNDILGIKFNSHFIFTLQFHSSIFCFVFLLLLDKSSMQKVNSFNSILTVYATEFRLSSLWNNEYALHKVFFSTEYFCCYFAFCSISRVSFPLNESASASQCTIWVVHLYDSVKHFIVWGSEWCVCVCQILLTHILKTICTSHQLRCIFV